MHFSPIWMSSCLVLISDAFHYNLDVWLSFSMRFIPIYVSGCHFRCTSFPSGCLIVWLTFQMRFITIWMSGCHFRCTSLRSKCLVVILDALHSNLDVWLSFPMLFIPIKGLVFWLSIQMIAQWLPILSQNKRLISFPAQGRIIGLLGVVSSLFRFYTILISFPLFGTFYSLRC